jgi:hypothetical protein
MLRGVVIDLDHERVSQVDFEHFSFTWNAVDTLIRDRLLTSNESRVDHGGAGAQDG